jgi:hypothetical protein
MRNTATRRVGRGLPLAVAALAVILCLVVPSTRVSAAPKAPRFGPLIEDYEGYTAPEECRPKAKPGVQAFADLLGDAYPSTSWIGIGRACEGTPTSDHQEGRALDWGRSANDRSDRKDVKDLFAWLFATDEHGNEDAMIRRLGITYLIWDREIWGTWSGWETYCVQKPAGCRDPDSHAILDPHTSHVHISFGWPGARMRTSFWNPDLSHPEQRI